MHSMPERSIEAPASWHAEEYRYLVECEECRAEYQTNEDPVTGECEKCGSESISWHDSDLG